MKNNLRKADLLFRYGGEEFVVLLPETTVQNAFRVGEKLRKKVEEHFRTTDYQLSGNGVTVSIGIANFPVDAYSAEKLLQIADDRLYEAKNSGKNRTVATDPSAQEV
jgi:diguanylate cyclase (GGDEF)-like protein